MSVFDIHDFDKYREDNRREVKKAKGGLPISLWDTYSSMCNTYGGVIICGVKEKSDGSWHTTGLKYGDLAKLKKEFWDTINNPKKNSINLLTEKDVVDYQIGEDLILVIYVPKAPREIKPVYINDNIMGGTFKRNWEGDYHCTPREVKAMLRDQAEQSPDMKVLENQEMEDLDYESIKLYRVSYNNRHEGSSWTKLPDDEFLIKIGAASKKTSDKKIHPTAAGLLMFGQEYLITNEYPEFFLDYREKLDPSVRWTDRVQTQSGDFSGNVFDFYTRVYRKLTADFKVPFKLENGIRVDETPKHKSVREALANALVNTDYYQGWSVVIEKYPDKIVMANPGTIILGKKQMLRGGISEPRNKNMFKMFNLIGIGEHAGSGVPDIYDVWKTEGLIEPTVEEQFGSDVPDRTTLTLPLIEIENDSQISGQESNNIYDKNKNVIENVVENVVESYPDWWSEKAIDLYEKYSKSKQSRLIEILNQIKMDNRISAIQIAKNIGVSERTVQRYIKEMKDAGILNREGSDIDGSWQIW